MVDYLLVAKAVSHLSHSDNHRDCCLLPSLTKVVVCCRSLVVFTKSQLALVPHDKGEIVLETCEIEEQGMMGLLALHVASKGHNCLVFQDQPKKASRGLHTCERNFQTGQ